MRAYIIKRLLLMIPSLVLLTFLIFLVVHLLPGDMIDAMEATSSEAYSGLDRAALEKDLGLDAPLLTQYGRWMGLAPQSDGSFSGVFQGNLGVSWWTKDPVLELVATRWPVTAQLGLMAIIVAQVIALPIGIYSALRQDSWGDYISRTFAILCISIPGFWLATIVIVYPAIWWDYMPPILYSPLTEDPLGNLRMLIIPSIVLGMATSGGTMRVTRTMMLEVLRQDYIRTAWAKGLRERVITLRHALGNALIPVVTIIGPQVLLLVGGSVIIEQIFGLPGMGRLILSAIIERDEPLVSGIFLVLGVGLMFINLMVDLAYGFLDPRVRYR